MKEKMKEKSNKFICPKCEKVYLKDDKYTKWNHWCKCSCGEKAVWDNRPVHTTLTKFIKGMDCGYNEGLGVNIRDRKHYKEVVKKSGAQPL